MLDSALLLEPCSWTLCAMLPFCLNSELWPLLYEEVMNSRRWLDSLGSLANFVLALWVHTDVIFGASVGLNLKKITLPYYVTVRHILQSIYLYLYPCFHLMARTRFQSYDNNQARHIYLQSIYLYVYRCVHLMAHPLPIDNNRATFYVNAPHTMSMSMTTKQSSKQDDGTKNTRSKKQEKEE